MDRRGTAAKAGWPTVRYDNGRPPAGRGAPGRLGEEADVVAARELFRPLVSMS